MVHVNEESRSSQEIRVITSSNFVSYLKLFFLTHFGQWSCFVPPENPRFSEGIKRKHTQNFATKLPGAMTSCALICLIEHVVLFHKS